ncbi:HipA domain-containing protein [Shewanella sp. BJSY2023SW005]|uniref:HipA domain-containing protein n=1 Tax=Shewanella sp. BJSY2023SW005 TaxID=3392043 RepID=UPI0039B3B7EC
MGEIPQANATLDLKDSVENEYLCIELAKALGFAVPSVNIIKTDNLKALAVKRFDRRWTKACYAYLKKIFARCLVCHHPSNMNLKVVQA